MPSSATFHVINSGYDNLELRVATPQDKDHAPLQVRLWRLMSWMAVSMHGTTGACLEMPLHNCVRSKGAPY